MRASVSSPKMRGSDMAEEIWTDVTAEYKGKTIRGSFKADRGLVSVRSEDGFFKSTYVGRSPPEATARRLLCELAALADTDLC
jgi:hypothetical protein